MDPGKLEYYEFLDLSDIDENERQQLKQTLYSTSTPEFLQLPWTNHNFVSEEWQKESYEDEVQPVPNGPLAGSCPVGDERLLVSPGVPHLPPVTIYSQPPPYTLPPPSSGYQHPQHPQNVFVSGVSPYITGHYYTLPEPQAPLGHPGPPEMGRGHRGRSRGRGGNKRMEEAQAPGFGGQFVPMAYHPAYYGQVGGPMQHHPSAQHATGSPLYIAPVYTPVYGAYHPHGHQYYTPPNPPHVTTTTAEIVQPIYQTQTSEEDYDGTVIVNSNADPAGYMNNVNVIPKTETEPFVDFVETFSETEPVSVVEFVPVNVNNNVQTVPEPSPNPKVKVTVDNSVSCVSVNKTVEVQERVHIEPATSSAPSPNAQISPSPHAQIAPSPPAQIVSSPPSQIASSPPAQIAPSPPAKVAPSPPSVKALSPPSVPAQSPPSLTAPPAAQLAEPPAVSSPSSSSPSPAPPPGKSWASLFNKNAGANATHASYASSQAQVAFASEAPDKDKPAHVHGRSVNNSFKAETETDPDSEEKHGKPPGRLYTNDPISHRIGEFILKYTLDNRTVSLQPRGLTNRSNYCYINSILQALLACPPFYNLLKALPYQPRKNSGAKSPTPIIDSMIDFVNEFTPLSAESRLNRKEKGQRKDNIDVICGIAFEPARIYKILNGIRTDTFIVEGRQEDAEEFFGCLLNGLNDEMLELSKLADGQSQQLSNGDIATNGESHEQDDEWTVMGPKNKGSITRRADFGRTPISDIFRGQLRSRVHRAGDQITDNVQPFFTLQLDIEKTSTVYEALELLVNKDKLEGVTCSRTNQQVEAWQQVTIEELPLVMVLHLKCFNYKLDACSKIIKNVEFPIDLKIDSKLLSSKAKYSVKQKQYKLFAVVYHDGKEASKGHYLTDAYHVGYGGWVRYDDATVKSVQENHVLHPNAARVPYLLYYRRCDTIGNHIKRD